MKNPVKRVLDKMYRNVPHKDRKHVERSIPRKNKYKEKYDG